MMNPVHLLWIVPLSSSFGFLWGALLAISGEEDF